MKSTLLFFLCVLLAGCDTLFIEKSSKDVDVIFERLDQGVDRIYARTFPASDSAPFYKGNWVGEFKRLHVPKGSGLEVGVCDVRSLGLSGNYYFSSRLTFEGVDKSIRTSGIIHYYVGEQYYSDEGRVFKERESALIDEEHEVFVKRDNVNRITYLCVSQIFYFDERGTEFSIGGGLLVSLKRLVGGRDVFYRADSVKVLVYPPLKR